MSLDLDSPWRDPLLRGSGDPNTPTFPDIEVQLTGTSSNAGAIMHEVSAALAMYEVPLTMIDQFREECMSGNYMELLQTVQRWVRVR